MPGLRLRTDVPMSEFTTLRLGGPADLFAEPAGEVELRSLLREASEASVPVTVVGQGSNLLVLDGGIRGLVIHMCSLRDVSVCENTIRAEAGVPLALLSQTAASHGLAGLAFAAGIPGSLGGGLCMNAGAYGGELSDHCVSVRCVSMDGNINQLSADDLAFSYRHSILQVRELIAVSAEFQLPAGDPALIRAEMRELNQKRAEKQPLDAPSCGSAFKRPEGAYAAELIERCGLKGYTVGGASVSEKHAGFLINHGHSSKDYLKLLRDVQRIVLNQTGYELQPEVRVLGEP